VRANVLVVSQLSLSQFTISPSAGSIQFVSPEISPPGCVLSSFCATAFAQAQDSLGGLQQQFNVGDNSSASASALTLLANANAAASAPLQIGSVSDGVTIGNLTASASSTAQATLYATFEVIGTSNPVTLSFNAMLDGQQTLSTDSDGVFANSEVIFSAQLDNGDIPVFFDSPLSIGPSASVVNPITTTLTGNSSMIQPDTNVSIVVQLDAESSGLNIVSAPEPSTWLAVLVALGAGVLIARRKTIAATFLLFAAFQLLTPHSAEARYIGAQTPTCSCACACSCTCANPSASLPSNTSSLLSLSQGNVAEQLALSAIKGGVGAGISLNAIYNSYDADGSLAQVDTVMGYGWTHSYNIFLFDQVGGMFRYDGLGHVTKYGLGPNGTFVTSTGYFETLVKNGDGTFTLTQKDKTVYKFASVTGTPFLVGGPVWRLVSVTDRNGNVTTLTYTAGNLTSITNVYGRSITLSYNGQNKISSVSDPDGRVTTFQYDSTGHLLTAVTDPNGNKVQYAYNVLFQLTSKTDKAGRVFTYSYQQNLPVAIRDGGGTSSATLSNPTSWATNSTQLALFQMRVYTPSTVTSIDGRGNLWQYQYDANGYLIKTIAPDGATSSYTYDPAALSLSTSTDANGHTTSYRYDSQGNLIQMTDALGHVTSYTYEPVFNMMASMTDPLGRTYTYGYDAHGNRILATDPLSQNQSWTYDGNGNVLTMTDQNGHTTTSQYDGFGNLVQITDPIANISHITYDPVGNVLSRTDPNNHTTSYQYDGLNRVTVETDATGHSTQTFYDGEGNRIQTIDRNNHSTSYQFDLRQRLIKMTDAVNNTETYTYDGNDNRLSLTDRNGHITAYQYDTQNRLIKVTDANGGISTTAYDPIGNVTSSTDANGHTATSAYDSLNRRVTMTDALGEATGYQYDTGAFSGCAPSCGATPGSRLVTGKTDANGKVIYYKYDALDRLIKIVRKVGSTADTITPADAVTTYTYDPANNRLTVTEPDGNTTTNQYDADNRVTQGTNAAGDVTMTTYDPSGNVATVTAPNLNVTANSYDPLNRVIQITDSAGQVAKYTYDPVGNRTSSTDGNGNTTLEAYDPLNRLTTETDALGKTTQFQYDPVGNRAEIIDRNGNVETFLFDAINRRISSTDALNHTTLFQYDPVGNLTKITDANSHSTQYFYDAVNRPLQETYADGLSRQYTYDSVGNLHTRTDQIGQMTTYTYNDLYFLTARSYPSLVNDTMTYDLSGRLLTAQHGSWLVTFTYDGGNRLTQTVQNTHTIGYSYNIPGRTRTLTYPGGRTITDHTDARTRLDHTDDGGSPSIAQYTYDAANRVLTRVYRNGTSAVYAYNADNWILNLQHSQGATPFAGFSYAYDNEGNKRFENKLQDSAHSEAYQYDNIYRLITYKVGVLVGSTIPVPSTQTNYNLDPVGNWNSKTTDSITQTRVHNPVNELVQINSTALTYDADGNLANDGTFSYNYDEENRLLKVTRLSDSALVGQYQYDTLGRRVEKTADPAGTPVTTVYFYDDARIVEEQSTLGVTQATYVYGNYVDEVLTMDRGGQAYYYHQNALWSIEAVTDSTGAPVERYSYDAYGAVTVTTGSGVPVPPNSWGTAHSAIGNPWMFTGRQFDEESGMYYYRARVYDALKGRFLQRDPLGYIQGTNLYEYAKSNPQAFTDPKGTDTPDPKTVKALIDDLDSGNFEKRQKASLELEILALTNPSLRAMLRTAQRGQALELVQRLQQIIDTVDKVEADVKGGNGAALRERLDGLCNCASIPLMKATIAKILSTVFPAGQGATPLSDIRAAQEAYKAVFCSLTKCIEKLKGQAMAAAGDEKKKIENAYQTLGEEAFSIFGNSSRRDSLRNYLSYRLDDLKKSDMPAAQYIEDNFRKAVRDCK
jgi:RHS repeat-associated protein